MRARLRRFKPRLSDLIYIYVVLAGWLTAQWIDDPGRWPLWLGGIAFLVGGTAATATISVVRTYYRQKLDSINEELIQLKQDSEKRRAELNALLLKVQSQLD